MALTRPFSLGWHPVDPGPGPRSALLDNPPSPARGDLVAAYQQWRDEVERDEARLLRQHPSGPLWHPVALPDTTHVVPVYGGTEAAVEQVVTTVVTSGLECGLAQCRVVNLSGWDLSGSLRDQMATAQRNRALFESVSPRGSTVNLFGNPDGKELVALLVDALRVSAERSAGRQTQSERLELEQVVNLLTGPLTLDRIIDAVDVALGAVVRAPQLTVDEMRDLRDHFASVVSQRRGTEDRLTDLRNGLAALRGFGKDPSAGPEAYGNGRVSLRWYDVAGGRAVDEVELGRQLIARAVLQTFTSSSRDELLVVVSAERLSDEVRDELVGAAQRLRKHLVLTFSEFTDAGQRLLGYAGSSTAVFLKMPNPADATAAAEYLGREYKFVVNGISIAEGQTQDWSDAFGTSQSRGTSSTRTSGSSSGFGGGALNFSRSVGTSVSSSFEQGTSQTASHGGSRSTTSTTSSGRVHEYVVEPEVFQRMPADLMMVIGQQTVTIASCRNSLRRSKQTSRHPLAVP